MKIVECIKDRKHVVEYDTDIIPTQNEVEEIIQAAYSVAPSRFKAYPYSINVLGPNPERSESLWRLSETQNVKTSDFTNLGLMHIKTAPYTLIYTPRIAPPNAYHRKEHRKWELTDEIQISRKNRENGAIEVGMMAIAITGAVLERGWDTSYSICYPRDEDMWNEYPYVNYIPHLIQTIGKGKQYKYQTLSEEDLNLNTKPAFESVVRFIDDYLP